MTALVRSCGRVLTSGRFVSRWTFVTIAVVSLTVLAPAPSSLEVGSRLLVALIVAALFAAVWGLVGIAERRVRAPGVRVALLASAVLVTSTLRPLAHDRMSTVLGGADAGLGPWGFRVMTNVVAWTIALVGTAILVDADRSVRESNALLRRVVHDLDAARERARSFGVRAQSAIDEAVAELESPPPPMVDHIRRFGIVLRSRARLLDSLAAEPFAPPPRPPHRAPKSPASVRGPRLRLPPIGAVAVTYGLALLPYALGNVPLAALAAGLALTTALGVAGDLLARVGGVRRQHARQIALFACSAVLTGALLSGVALAQQIPPPLAGVPAVTYPAIAFALARALGAARSLGIERRRLSAAVARRTRADELGTRTARTGLRAAAEVLHRDGQGAAVLFVLQNPHPTSDVSASFLRRLPPLASAVRRAFTSPAARVGESDLDAVLDTWGRVMPVRAVVTPAARIEVQRHPSLARDAVDAVAEGLLNAAKHARDRGADVVVEVVATGAGRRVRVRVRSRGAPAPRARLRPGSRLDRLGARLSAVEHDTLLEITLAVAPDAPTSTTDGSVVSTEHFESDGRRRA